MIRVTVPDGVARWQRAKVTSVGPCPACGDTVAPITVDGKFVSHSDARDHGRTRIRICFGGALGLVDITPREKEQ